MRSGHAYADMQTPSRHEQRMVRAGDRIASQAAGHRLVIEVMPPIAMRLQLRLQMFAYVPSVMRQQIWKGRAHWRRILKFAVHQSAS